MSAADGLAPMTFATLIRSPEAVALEIFNALDTLGPTPVPPAAAFSDPGALRKWSTGAAMPELLVNEFARWLDATRHRTGVISENERRLRTTMWAQWRLKDVGDYFEQFAAFHRSAWGIPEVFEDIGDRELQVRACARIGATRWSRSAPKEKA